MQFTHEHEEIQRTLKRFIDEEINPHVDEWEAAESVSRAPGVQAPRRARPARPDQAREVRRHRRSTTRTRWRWPRRSATSPAAACRWRSACRPTWRRRRWRASAARRCAASSSSPAIAGDAVGCIGVSEPGAGSRRREHQDDGAQGRRRLRHQRRQDVDHQQPAGRLDVPARQHLGRRGAQEQEPDHGADETPRASSRRRRSARSA